MLAAAFNNGKQLRKTVAHMGRICRRGGGERPELLVRDAEIADSRFRNVYGETGTRRTTRLQNVTW
ncbi:hypothetical protein KIN20_031192 [Parelaphostrongylus tenuis]|uniref:Uncharacterized protein n=1 Tax=Parelaphostrongylus tenuis TaxID=148309 RepID=A0AAD5R515_PARTN|nr:hypothetical protein KIN20_031192 [Parelaphostrongylus tenuis]